MNGIPMQLVSKVMPGSEPVGDSVEAFSALLAKEVPMWTRIVRDAGLKPE